MVLKLTVYVRNIIYFIYKQKPSRILIFGINLAKLSILEYVLLKIGYFEDPMYVDVCIYFGM